MLRGCPDFSLGHWTKLLEAGPQDEADEVQRQGAFMRLATRLLAAVGVTIAIAACGSSTTTTPSNSGGPSDPATTITITSTGVSPKTLTVPRGSQVTVHNNDSRAHYLASDPHPTHENCPELNTWGTLSNGQSRQSANLTTAKTCTYHDHDNPGNTSLQGTVIIQ